MTVPRDWFVKAAPFLKFLSGTLSLVLPVASAATKLALDDASYRAVEKRLDVGQKCIESVLAGSERLGTWLVHNGAPGFEPGHRDDADVEHAKAIRAQGAILRQVHVWLKEKDPACGFGGLVRVQNKRQEFLWVHPQFEKEY